MSLTVHFEHCNGRVVFERKFLIFFILTNVKRTAVSSAESLGGQGTRPLYR